MIDLSVVIASHRPDYISACVDSLLNGGVHLDTTEIVIVTDYDIDGFATKHPHCVWIFVDDTSIAKKRNAGLGASNGPIVAFLDDDCTATSGWSRMAMEFLDKHPENIGVEGKTTIEQVDVSRTNLNEAQRLEQPGMRTNNVFFRRTSLVQLHQTFDERFAYQREDVDFAFSLIEHGQTIGYSEKIAAVHRLRLNEPWDLLKNCRNRRYDPLLYKKHPDLYRKHIRTPLTPSIICIGLLHIACIIGCIFSSRTGIFTACLDVVAVLFFTIRRIGFSRTDVFSLIKIFISYTISPVVLFSALIYGSIKFRKLFIV